MKSNYKGDMVKMAKLKGKTITKTYTDSEGVELKIIFSHPGARNGIKILQSAYTPEGTMDIVSVHDGLMDKVIKKEDGSKTNQAFWDDFEDLYEDVMGDAQKFLKGKLSDSQD